MSDTITILHKVCELNQKCVGLAKVDPFKLNSQLVHRYLDCSEDAISSLLKVLCARIQEHLQAPKST